MGKGVLTWFLFAWPLRFPEVDGVDLKLPVAGLAHEHINRERLSVGFVNACIIA